MNSQLNLFNNNLLLKGKKVLINNTTEPIKILIKEHENNKIGTDSKHIFIPIANVIKQGDIVILNGQRYLIVNKEFTLNGIYTKCIMQKLHTTFKVKYANTDAWTIDCFILDNIQTITQGTTVSIATGSIIVTIPYTTNTRLIIEGTRFFAMGKRVWRVAGVTTTDEGLIKLYCERDSSIVQEDDTVNLIAYNTITVDGDAPIEPEPPIDPEPDPEPTDPPDEIQGEDEISLKWADEWTITNINDKPCTWTTDADYITIQSFDNHSVILKCQDKTTHRGKTFTLTAEYGSTVLTKIIKVIS